MPERCAPSPRTDGRGRHRRSGGSHGQGARHGGKPDSLGAGRIGCAPGLLSALDTRPSGRSSAGKDEPVEEGTLRRLALGQEIVSVQLLVASRLSPKDRRAMLTGASLAEAGEIAIAAPGQ